MASARPLRADDDGRRITVAAALRRRSLRAGLPEVVLGAESLDRPVRWVHSGEDPLLVRGIKGGELLITAGMGLGDDPEVQRRFVAELATRGVAALVLAANEIPPALLDEARRRELPLIRLHRVIAFIDVAEEINGEIVERTYAELRRGEEVQRRLTRVVLEGDGVAEALRALADIVENPVVLESERGELLHHARHRAEDAAVLAAWEDVHRSLAGGVDVSARATVAALPAGGGRLMALSLISPLEDGDASAVERAAGVVALALHGAAQEEGLLFRERGNFLVDLLEGRVPARDAPAQAAALGFSPNGSPLLAIVARAMPDPDAGAPRRHPEPPAAWTLLARDVLAALRADNVPALTGYHRRTGELVVLLALRSPEDRPRLADRVAAAIDDGARRRIDAPGGVAVAVAAACDWPGVGERLGDAAEKAATATSLPPQPWHDARRVDADRLLWRWRDDQALATFVQRSLGPVIEHDRARAGKLMPTLEALCARGGRKAETARALYLGRQTLYDRIARLERLLGADLSDSDTLLDLRLALRAQRYLHSEEP